MMVRKARWVVGLICTTLMLAGCSASPPDSLKRSADSLSGEVKAARTELTKAQKAYASKLDGNNYAFMKAYSAEQLHTDRFGQAKSKLDEARSIVNKEIKPSLENYEEGDDQKISQATSRGKALTGDARRLIAEPIAWADKILATKNDSDGTVRESQRSLQVVNTSYDPLKKGFDGAKKTNKSNADAIDQKLSSLTAMHVSVMEANDQLKAEANKASPNYAEMTRLAEFIRGRSTTFDKQATAAKTDLASLDMSESRTLVDIKVVSTVQISRTSWDESVDGGEKDYEYPPIEVDDLNLANYFARFSPDDVLTRINSGWGDDEFEYVDADREHWNKLHINTKKDWPSDHSDAEFYVGYTESYCHQLRVLKSGTPDISKRPAMGGNYCSRFDSPDNLRKGIYWVVSDKVQSEYIGMDLYGKGRGEFADQASEVATPPGLVYVDDESAGEWREDSHGNSFWHFYGQYAFFRDIIGAGQPYYTRAEVNEWKRHYKKSHRPYFAGTPKSPRFGSHSSLVTSRFPHSSYVQKNLHTQPVRRGVGPANRAGGPGKGGK